MKKKPNKSSRISISDNGWFQLINGWIYGNKVTGTVRRAINTKINNKELILTGKHIKTKPFPDIRLLDIHKMLKEAHDLVLKTFPDDWQERMKPVEKVINGRMQQEKTDQVLVVLPDLLHQTNKGINALLMATVFEMIKNKDYGTTKPA